ncbi:C-C motif chemokine 20 [Siniperca chuatsi]|uniref:C-C motif chemokine 20 n=1 Tax=Siniperca chuatsi TaxID=119488 RepID=UPI001CE0F1D6|nr:C-C motif chemokine 20 [Siniperca chuatsi]
MSSSVLAAFPGLWWDITIYHLTEYLNFTARDKLHQVIPFESPDQKTDSLLKRSCVRMAKLTVCVSIIMMLLVALGESSPMRLCCTQYQENPIPVKVLKYYRIQEVTEDCNIKAVIFKTVKNRLLCASPDSKWVKKAMESVPQ